MGIHRFVVCSFEIRFHFPGDIESEEILQRNRAELSDLFWTERQIPAGSVFCYAGYISRKGDFIRALVLCAERKEIYGRRAQSHALFYDGGKDIGTITFDTELLLAQNDEYIKEQVPSLVGKKIKPDDLYIGKEFCHTSTTTIVRAYVAIPAITSEVAPYYQPPEIC